MAYQVEEFIEQIFESLKLNKLSFEVLNSMEYDVENDNNINSLLE